MISTPPFVLRAWLAVCNDPGAVVTVSFCHMQPRAWHPAASEAELQEKLLTACKRFSGVDSKPELLRPSLLYAIQLAIQIGRRTDKSEMSKCLREVSQMLSVTAQLL